MEENKDLNAPYESDAQTEETIEQTQAVQESEPVEAVEPVETTETAEAVETVEADATEEAEPVEAAILTEEAESAAFAAAANLSEAEEAAAAGNAEQGEQQPEKMKKSLKVTLTILIVILALLLGIVALAYGYYRSKIGQLQPDETRDPNETLSSSEIEDMNKDPFGDEMDDLVGNLPTVDATFPSNDGNGDRPEYLDHVTNILLIGTDERTADFSSKARGDSCMLLSINTMGESPVVSLISFERGMGMPILSGKYAGQWDWLTHLFRYGGAEMMMESIEACFDIEIDYYVRTNFACFRKGIDSLGGVDIKFTTREAEFFKETFNVDAVKGMNHLDGKNALRYARLRVIDSDWKRVERQRKVISAVITKLKNKNLTELDALIDVGIGLVRTNLTEDVITKLLLDVVPGLKNVEVQQMTIPQKGTYGSQKVMGDRSAYAPDFEVNTQLIHDMIYGLNKES